MLPNHAQFQTPLYRAAGYGQGPQYQDPHPQVQNVANYLSGLNNAGPAAMSPFARRFSPPPGATPQLPQVAGGAQPPAQPAPGSVTGLPFSPAAMAQNIAAQHPAPAGMPMPQANVQAPPSTPGGPGGPAPAQTAPMSASAAPSISPPAIAPRVLAGAGGPGQAQQAPMQSNAAQAGGSFLPPQQVTQAMMGAGDGIQQAQQMQAAPAGQQAGSSFLPPQGVTHGMIGSGNGVQNAQQMTAAPAQQAQQQSMPAVNDYMQKLRGAAYGSA